jgi:hypothetical protein
LLVGHNYGDIEKEVDFVNPLLSHPYIFSLLSFAAPTKQLLEWNEGLREKSILSASYGFSGYEFLSLPLSMNGLSRSVTLPGDFDEKIAADIMDLESRKTASYLSSRTPKFAYVSAQEEISPRGVVKRLNSLNASGMQGVIFQFGRFFSNFEGNVEAIRRSL